MTTGIELIAAERERQKTSEGWTESHDDQHRDGSLAMAAAAYAFPREQIKLRGPLTIGIRTLLWPSSWGDQWWKPKDRKRDLVRAGALIAAEIDRLQRAETDG